MVARPPDPEDILVAVKEFDHGLGSPYFSCIYETGLYMRPDRLWGSRFYLTSMKNAAYRTYYSDLKAMEWAKDAVVHRPDLIDIKPVTKAQAYAEHNYVFKPSPCSIAYWNDQSWINYIDRNNWWTVPIKEEENAEHAAEGR